MLNGITAALRIILCALSDHFRGRKRCRFQNVIKINAAPELIWQTIWSSGRFDGVMPVDYQISPLDSEPDHYQASLTINDICHKRTFRVGDDWQSKAISAEYVPQETDNPTAVEPHNFALVLENMGNETRVMHVEEVSVRRLWDRIFYPIATRWVLELLKCRCEAGSAKLSPSGAGARIWGIFFAVAAFLTYWYIANFSWAILLITALAIHEYGHVLAMRIIGLPTSGFYALPFIGASDLPRSKPTHLRDTAFCALMGPGFSLVPSLLLFAVYIATGHAVPGAAAALFTFVNLLNLLPIPLFDGGTITRSIFRSLTSRDFRVLSWILLVIGLALSLYEGLLIFGVCLALMSYLIADLPTQAPEHTRMSKSDMFSIISAMIFIGALYGAILYVTLRDSGVTAHLALN
ncbi:MAG: hypothetical protein ACR2OX_09900 [Methyloligellaceae bacterium]